MSHGYYSPIDLSISSLRLRKCAMRNGQGGSLGSLMMI